MLSAAAQAQTLTASLAEQQLKLAAPGAGASDEEKTFYPFQLMQCRKLGKLRSPHPWEQKFWITGHMRTHTC